VVPPESDDNQRLQIGHVLFIDIVGYSKLLNEEQKERLKNNPRFIAFAQKIGVMPTRAVKP
jgi:hypothetical protein